MRFFRKFRLFLFVIILSFAYSISFAQLDREYNWNKEGNGYYKLENGGISEVSLQANKETILVSGDKLTPAGQTSPLSVSNFYCLPTIMKY